ncbi:hypothetical protein SJDPG12_00050 [Porphyromonas gingivalis SJD12]|nr:hypothetical protein SJDPG12_00050 [Porphyromonas gingivalis SJD12]
MRFAKKPSPHSFLSQTGMKSKYFGAECLVNEKNIGTLRPLRLVFIT